MREAGSDFGPLVSDLSLLQHASKYVVSVGVSHHCLNILLGFDWRVVGVADELNVQYFRLSSSFGLSG